MVWFYLKFYLESLLFKLQVSLKHHFNIANLKFKVVPILFPPVLLGIKRPFLRSRNSQLVQKQILTLMDFKFHSTYHKIKFKILFFFNYMSLVLLSILNITKLIQSIMKFFIRWINESAFRLQNTFLVILPFDKDIFILL